MIMNYVAGFGWRQCLEEEYSLSRRYTRGIFFFLLIKKNTGGLTAGIGIIERA